MSTRGGGGINRVRIWRNVRRNLVNGHGFLNRQTKCNRRRETMRQTKNINTITRSEKTENKWDMEGGCEEKPSHWFSITDVLYWLYRRMTVRQQTTTVTINVCWPVQNKITYETHRRKMTQERTDTGRQTDTQGQTNLQGHKDTKASFSTKSLQLYFLTDESHD